MMMLPFTAGMFPGIHQHWLIPTAETIPAEQIFSWLCQNPHNDFTSHQSTKPHRLPLRTKGQWKWGDRKLQTPCLQSAKEPAIHSYWGSTGMVQMDSVFLSLKPPAAAIKHRLLIKIHPVLFLGCARLHVVWSPRCKGFVERRVN